MSVKYSKCIVVVFLFVYSFVQAQNVNEGIYFQALARDKALHPAMSRPIYVQTSILQHSINGQVVFGDQHQVNTDETGVFSIMIGQGLVNMGSARSLKEMSWNDGPFFINLKVAITPVSPSASWDYTKEWVDLGTSPFGTVPFALHVLGTSTVTMDTTSLSSRINNKLNLLDTAAMLSAYYNKTSLDALNTFNLKYTDTIHLSDRIQLKENSLNKSSDISNIAYYNHVNFPTVKAVKDYIDNALIAGAPDASTNNKGIVQLTGDLSGTASVPTIANNAINTAKIQDAAITDAKIANGINPSKVGLGNLSNNAQLYNLNGLTTQIQNFGVPGNAGLSPNWTSLNNTHTLHIPLAASSGVIAGLISNSDYNNFNNSAQNSITGITTNGNNGSATLSGHAINIPNYTLVGLAGSANANTIFAGPANGSAANAVFRNLVSNDIPNNAANTTGNAATASKLITPKNINGVAFDGTNDISIASVGTITAGTWSASVIGANYGGAGYNNGVLKANGLGVVSAAIAGTDFQVPINFSSPLINNANTVSLPQADAFNSGYLTTTDWTNFHNKMDQSTRGALNGVASLDANGKVPTSQIPAISFSSGYVVTSQSAMLALSSAVVGSIAIRTDNSKNYVLSGLPASTLSNWLELLMPVSITSVNGHTESNISLTSSDIAEGTNLYYTDAKVRAAITANTPLNYNASTGVFSITAASGTSAGYLSALDWNTFNNKLGNFTAQAPNTFFAGPIAGNNANPSFRNMVAADVPTLNQNTTGNAATATTATKLATVRNINGVAFDGSSDITIASMGTITSGTWSATVIDANHGGAGTVNGVLKANGAGLVSAAVAGIDYESALSFSAPLTRTVNAISLPAATTSSNGYLTATDWNLFNAKQATIVAGTGVNITGGNTIAIGQAVATTASPSFAGANITGDLTAKRYKLTMPTAITSAATTNIDLSTGNVFTVSLGTNISSLNLTNPAVGTYLIKFVQDATGSRVVSFPAEWKWAGAVVPTLTPTANKLDIVTLIYDGTTYYATIVYNF